MGISLLIPTRGRPESMERFARSVDATTSSLENVEIVFGIDKGDTDSFTKANELSKSLQIAIQVKEMTPWHDGDVNLASYWNQCYVASKYDIVGYFGDDVVFHTKGWDAIVAQLLKNTTLMIAPNSVHQPMVRHRGIFSGPAADLFFTHKSVHSLFGYYLHESLRRYCTDMVLEFIYKRSGTFRYCDYIVTEHITTYAFPKITDDTHIRMAKWGAEGFSLFESDMIQKEIIRCSDLLNDMVLKFKTRKGTNILQRRSRGINGYNSDTN